MEFATLVQRTGTRAPRSTDHLLVFDRHNNALLLSLSRNDETKGTTSQWFPGYDLDLFIDRECTWLQQLVCTVCSHVVRDPVYVESRDSCGHVFCRSCVSRWITQKREQQEVASCPTCRKKWTNADLAFKSVSIVKRLVDSARVKCAHQDCNWTGTLDSMQDPHLNQHCAYAPIPCKFVPAEHPVLPRAQQVEHEKECPSRLVECDLCQKSIPLDCVSKHKASECPESLISCPLGCFKGIPADVEEVTVGTQHVISSHFVVSTADQKEEQCYPQFTHCTFCPVTITRTFKRGDLEKHVGTCPLEPVNCPLCTWKGVRVEFVHHMMSRAIDHFTIPSHRRNPESSESRK